MSLNTFDFTPILKRLDFNTEIKPFESELKEFDEFLFDDAKKYLEQKLAVTYLLSVMPDTFAHTSRPPFGQFCDFGQRKMVF